MLPSSSPSLSGHRRTLTGSDHEFQDVTKVRTPATICTRGSTRQTEKKSRCCDAGWKQRCADRCSNCITRFTRLFLVIPNIIFLILGSTLIGVGVWIRADRDSIFYAEILKNVPAGPLVTFDKFPVVIIAVGSCVAILSFLGCCGACAESVCFLCLYTLFLILIVVAEIVLGLVVIIMREQMEVKLESSMHQQVKDYYNFTTSKPLSSADNHNNTFFHHFTVAWDKMQNEFDCCGSSGPEDYQYSHWYNQTSGSSRQTQVPNSCCYLTMLKTVDNEGSGKNKVSTTEAQMIRNCQADAKQYWAKPTPWKSKERTSGALKTQGCKQSVIDLFRRNITIVIGIVSGIVILQILDFVFACVLMRFVHKKLEEPSWYDDEDYD